MFDANGYLAGGIHDYDEGQFESDFVTAFPSSVTRKNIFAGYMRHASDLLQIVDRCEQLIDGSFVTNKNDPGDVDLVCFVDKDELDNLSLVDQAKFTALVSGKSTKSTHFCDSYFVPTVPIGHPLFEEIRKLRKYWLGEFSFDRTENPKGIVRRILTP